MIKKFLFSVIIILFLFTAASPAESANSLDIIINEIAWMGTEVSYNDEWIELYNNSENPISLDGWTLKTDDGTPEIKLSDTIPAKGFYLLERTDDNTVPEITANLIYKGALENNGEVLKLYDSSENLVDEVNNNTDWFAGNNETKQTMERKDSLTSGNNFDNWQNSQNAGGTPKAKNSVFLSQVEPKQQSESPPKESPRSESELLPQKESQPGPKPKSEPVTYPSGVLINEILPSPEGSDETEEWIEIFNQNDYEIDLSDWKIEDIVGKITAYVFSKETKVPSQGFLVLSRPTSKITLNNDKDGLNFIQPDGKIIDSISYEKSPLNQSYNRIKTDWVWSSVLTPSSTNITPQEKTEVPIEENKLTTEIDTESKIKIGTATIGKTIPKSSNPLWFFLIAFVIAVSSGIFVFVFKKYHLNKN